jgi:hypothetical protein
MDMVGGGPVTKSVFHVSGGPASLPSFVHDVSQSIGAWVNDETYKYAATGESAHPFVAPTGGKEPLLAQLDEFDMGSDHEVYQEASWRIPAVYLHDWPDRYIHTTQDTPDKIDPTKLLRAGFIGAASGYFLASMSNKDADQLARVMDDGQARESLRASSRSSQQGDDQPARASGYDQYRSTEIQKSLRAYLNPSEAGKCATFGGGSGNASGDGALVFVRNPKVSGPMTVFGYDYLKDKIGEDRYNGLRLLKYQGKRGAGGDYAYEVLNWTYWHMRAVDIRNLVSTTYGSVPLDQVVEFLKAAEEAGLVTRADKPLNCNSAR